MDTLGALALATEPPTDHLMGRPPVGRKYVCSLWFLTVLLNTTFDFVLICFDLFLQRASDYQHHVEKLVDSGKQLMTKLLEYMKHPAY